jgi:hypothetical protein
MMKFFRKHNKKLLAIFMCLLLVCWLGGDALTAIMKPAPGKDVIATYAAGNITRDQFNRVSEQTRLLQSLGLNWQRPLGGMQAVELDVPSWYLLVREARAMGVQSSRPIAEATLDQFQEGMRKQGRNMPTVAFLASRLRERPEAIYEAVEAFTDVVRYASRSYQAVGVNAAEVRAAAADEMNQVQLKAVALAAEMFVQPEETFSDAELREQFDKFRNAQRGAGMNFGYVLPPRVKVQYAKIDAQKLEETLAIDPQKIEKEANRFWRGNKQAEAFRRPADEKDAASQPTSEPASAPASQPTFYTTWAEAQPAAIRELRRQYAAERAQNLASWFVAQTAEPWFHVETNSNGYKDAPDTAKALTHYADILGRVPVSLPGAAAVTVEATDWIAQEDAQKVPGLGMAALRDPTGQPVSFASVALNVQGLAKIPTGEEAAGIDRGAFMALYQTCPYVMQDADGNTYIFRPVAVDQERPAKDLDEVRDRVVADLRLKRGYERAEAAAKAFNEKVADGGVQAAWEADTALQETAKNYTAKPDMPGMKRGLIEKISVTRRQGTEPTRRVMGLGAVNDAFVTACFELGAAEGAAPRTRVLSIPESATVAVVEWVKNIPLDEQMFKDRQQMVAQMLERKRAMEYLAGWLDPQTIKARNRFEYKRGG